MHVYWPNHATQDGLRIGEEDNMRVNPPHQTETLLIDWRTVGPFMTNSFLVMCQKTKEAVIVDSSAEGEVLQQMIKAHGADVRYLLQTHAHLDHVGALGFLKDLTGAPILIHEAEMPLYDSVPMQCQLFGLPPMDVPPAPDKMIAEGDRITFGELEAVVIETPGHTPGGISFLLDGFLFGGDTLFAGSIGRTDLPGGDHAVLMRSLQTLTELPEETLVFSGHGPVTSIGREKQYNPFL